jgi:putative transposase
MPRQDRIDYQGALHHVVVRGINRCRIFKDDRDRGVFYERLERYLTETATPCYAWALIPNHFHLLLMTGQTPIRKAVKRGQALINEEQISGLGHEN